MMNLCVKETENGVSLSNAKGRSKGEIIAGMLGSSMEWYDFAVFGYFSDVIANVFFPPEQGHTALMQSFFIFGSAFLVRPIGSVVFGKIGDTYGRKVALMSSILLMATATFTIGCLPTYNIIGWLSCVLLLMVRMLQGLSVGGQFTTALLFNMEGKPTNTWAFSGAIVYASSSGGIIVGSLVGYNIRQALDQKDLDTWGWRIPFLAGAMLGLPGLYLKYHNEESDIDSKIRENKNDARSKVKLLLGSKHRRIFIPAVFVPMIGSASYYLTFVWVPVFMNSLVNPPIEQSYLINSVSIVISALAYLLVGIVSDKYFKRTQLMLAGGTCLILFSPMMIVIIGKGEPMSAFFVQVLLSVFGALWITPNYAWLAQSFPPHVRLSGLSISWNVASATFGGFAPALATLLFDKFGPTGPGLLISCISSISMVALWMAPPIIDHRTKKPVKAALPEANYNERSLLILNEENNSP